MSTQLDYFLVCEEDVFPSHRVTAPREGRTNRPIRDGATAKLGDKVLPIGFSLEDAIEFANDERINGMHFANRPLSNIEMHAISIAGRAKKRLIALLESMVVRTFEDFHATRCPVDSIIKLGELLGGLNDAEN